MDTDRLRERKLSRKGTEIDSRYAGKTHDFGGNIQALTSPRGIPLWASDVLPDGVHDITASRTPVLAIPRPHLRDLPVLAEPGHQGTGPGALTPVKKPHDSGELDITTKTCNKLLRALQALGERSFTLLTQRRTIPQHVTMSPRKIGTLARAALALTHFEHKTITA